MKKIFYLLSVLLILLTGCSASGISIPGLQKPIAIIDWVDFIKLRGGITYQAAGYKIDKADLGVEVGKVQFKLAENVHDPNYKTQDGDAAFLEPGTPIYQVMGYKPEFRLAVPKDGGFWVYEADSNPGATKGSELLDIGGKVKYIGINSETDGKTELAKLDKPELVSGLVKMVMDAPIDPGDKGNSGKKYFLEFHLKDGSSVTKAFWIESGELARGIMLPSEFRETLEKAIAK